MDLLRKKEKGQKIELVVQGMTCNHCEMRVKKALMGVAGVQEAEVSLVRGQAMVTFDPKAGVTIEALIAAVEGAGYEAKPAVD